MNKVDIATIYTAWLQEILDRHTDQRWNGEHAEVDDDRLSDAWDDLPGELRAAAVGTLGRPIQLG